MSRSNRSDIIDLTGRRFGMLSVVERAESKNGARWLCRCDCGQETIARTGHLNARSKISCGCAVISAARKNQKLASAALTTHGMSHSRLDECYKNILRRCYDQKNKRYDRYGGRGIKVCAEWLDNKQSFFDWAAANGYAADLTIERDDRNGDYEPGNCIWADRFVQANNCSDNRILEWDGRSQTVAQWAREIGVRPKALQHRVDRGWNLDRIFTQPYRRRA